MNVITLPVGAYQANCYIVYDNAMNAFIVDPGAEPDRILRMIKQYHLKVQTVLLTHHHFDHIAAADAILRATGAQLALAEADAMTLSDPSRTMWAFARVEGPCPLKADRVLHDGDMLTVGEMTVQVLCTPGHTPGSCCYLVDDVMFSGDTLFLDSIGRVDFAGGSPRDMIDSLQKLADLDGDYTVYAGHGDATRLSREKAHNPYMRRHTVW